MEVDTATFTTRALIDQLEKAIKRIKEVLANPSNSIPYINMQ